MKKRLLEALHRREHLGRDPRTSAYRLVHARGDGLPGLTVDRFADTLVLSLYEHLNPQAEQELIETLAGVAQTHFGLDAIYLKRRPREARHLANTERDWLAPPDPVWGQERSELEVLEDGLRYLIRPGGDLSVGLFLDMRLVRRWLRSQVAGLRVLNTFAYTCAFGVNASVGAFESERGWSPSDQAKQQVSDQEGGQRQGIHAPIFAGQDLQQANRAGAAAARVVNLDLSRRVLDWGEENYRLNQLEPVRQDFIAGDVFDWLGRMGRWQDKFDLVILDPPSYAKSRLKRFSAAAHYDQLIELVAPVVAPGGRILACCNHAGLSKHGFAGLLQQGLQRAKRNLLEITPLPVSDGDFPGEPALKTYALRLN